MNVSRRGFIGTLAAFAAAVTMPLTKAKAAALNRVGFYQYGRYYGRVPVDRITCRLQDGTVQFLPRDNFAIVGLIFGSEPRWMTDEELALSRSNPQALMSEFSVRHSLTRSD